MYEVIYDDGGFYLVIDDIKGYFNVDDNVGSILNMILTNDKKMISIKIKDPLFTFRARLVNILDFNPKKLSIEKVCAIDDEQEHIYYIKYGGDPFYLVINDLKGYFKYSKEKNTTEPSSSEHR